MHCVCSLKELMSRQR